MKSTVLRVYAPVKSQQAAKVQKPVKAPREKGPSREQYYLAMCDILGLPPHPKKKPPYHAGARQVTRFLKEVPPGLVRYFDFGSPDPTLPRPVVEVFRSLRNEPKKYEALTEVLLLSMAVELKAWVEKHLGVDLTIEEMGKLLKCLYKVEKNMKMKKTA